MEQSSTLQAASLLGSQEPSLLRLPEHADDFSWGDLALEFADEAGYELDLWQRFLVRWTFARRYDGIWAARDVAVEVARQNGKNIWLEVVELCSLLLFGDRLFTHTAQRADTSHEHFISLRDHIRESPFLMGYMPKRHNDGFVTTNGNESIEFLTPDGVFRRLLFKARAQSSGRGPRPQKIAFDEALVLDRQQVGTMAPGISAQPNPQILFASSSPKEDSEQLHALRARALEPQPEDDRFFFAGWCNEEDADPKDPETMRRANPSLGYGRLTVSSIESNRRLMTEADYVREHLGIPEPPPVTATEVSDDEWNNLIDRSSTATSSRAWALAVSSDRKWATIGVAGRREDGLFHVEWKTRKPGTAWVVDEVVKASEKMDTAVRIHRTGPTSNFITQLQEKSVEVTEISSAEAAQATASFLDAIQEGRLRHLGQDTIGTQLAAATLRYTQDSALLWSQKSKTVPIDALMAITIALGGVFQPTVEDDGWFAY